MPERRPIVLSVLLITVSVLAAYCISLRAPLVFDDIPSILDNPSIRQLWPLSGPLSPPREHGFTVSGRPLLNLTLALNYAISGREPWSYHVVNVGIHLGAALTLFGVLRRTLVLPAVAPTVREHAVPAACVTALLWALHPLQTESVTYIIQRAESLMGLLYFLTFYGFVRMAETGGSRAWGILSFFACLCGMATKEVTVTAPVLVLLFDGVFLSGGMAAAGRARLRYYLALAVTWVPLAYLVFSAGGDRGGTYKWDAAAFGHFWLTQPEALTRYLGLTLCPHPLIFEYGLATDQRPLAIAGYVSVVLTFLALTGWLWRRHRAAALGLLVFPIVLAPTSLMPSATQVIVEHRMYVPLAGLLAVAVAVLVAWQGRRGLMIGLVASFAAAIGTMARNGQYLDSFELWADTVEKRPTSAKAHNNLGHAYHSAGDLPTAIVHYREATRLEPGAPNAFFNLGLALEETGQPEEALQSYREAVRILPKFSQAQAQIGVLLAKAGQREEAARHLQEAHALNPNLPSIHLGMGLLLVADGKDAEAIEAFARALELAPGLVDAQLGWGVALARLGRFPEAIELLQQLTQRAPLMAEAHANLGIALAETGQMELAIASYREALRLRPAYANAHYNLGNAYVRLQRWADAKAEFEAALRDQPDFSAAREMLVRLQGARGN